MFGLSCVEYQISKKNKYMTVRIKRASHDEDAKAAHTSSSINNYTLKSTTACSTIILHRVLQHAVPQYYT
jgi:hypothetical protein